MENSIHCKMFLMTDSEKWMMMRLKVCGHPYQQNHSPEEEEVKPRRLGKKAARKKKVARKRRVEKKKKSSGRTIVRQEVKLLPRPGEREERPRPMSAKRTVEMSEIESIAAAFAKKGMDMPFSKETLENALLIPEDTPYEIAIRNLPLPGSGLISDPLQRKEWQYMELKAAKKKVGKKKGGKKKGGKKKKKIMRR